MEGKENESFVLPGTTRMMLDGFLCYENLDPEIQGSLSQFPS